MTTDMLRLAGEIEGVRTEAFAGGEIDDPRPAPLRRSPPPAAPAVDLRALVMRAVVPRLVENLRAPGMPAHPSDPHPSTPCLSMTVPASAAPSSREDGVVGELVDILLRDDLAGLCRTVEAARACGRPLERIYVDLLAPAAAAVAGLVDSDDCSTAAGTLAFSNLQIVLRRYAAAFYEEGGAARQGSRVLLVPMRAGSGLSTFGLLLAADLLRRAGWEAWVESSARSPTIEETVAGRWFDLVEVLAAGETGDEIADDEMREVAAAIRTIRREGANPRVVVVACGSAFARDPGLARRLGADQADTDPLAALRSRRCLPDDTSHPQTRRRRHLS